jgi:D-alanine-D-alanine ligase
MKTKNKKIRVAILCGGKSAEHEISLLSAHNVIQALNPTKYDIVIVGIDKNGSWFLPKTNLWLTTSEKLPAFISPQTKRQGTISPIFLSSDKPADVIFPVLHGPLGEDGTMQGLLKLMNIPFVGAGVLGSAIGMDKDVMKRLLKEADISIAKFLVFHQHKRKHIQFATVVRQLGLPIFVKPANLGSSIGVSKVTNQKEFERAIDVAFSFDTKILVEQAVKGREIECSILGNKEEMIASLPGEIILHDEFYSYKTKYLDPHGASLGIPAKLSTQVIKKVQATAIKTCQVLCIEGMSRVDCFVTPNNKVYVNEVNTIPGFTQISMYPKLWEASGIPYSILLDKLITLAIKRHQRDNALKTSVE